MTLKELKKAVQEGRREAMLRWARLDPEEATPWLAKLIEDVKENCGSAFNDQRAAASALARIGDARGLAWLRKTAENDVGYDGNLGACLLAAGEEGRKIYFTLVREHIDKKRLLPTTLLDAPHYSDGDLLCKLLPEFFAMNDDNLQTHFCRALAYHPLPAGSIVFLAEQARKVLAEQARTGNYGNNTPHNCNYCIAGSLCHCGWQNLEAHHAAQLWVCEMLGQDGTWYVGAEVFLCRGLGGKELAVAGARRYLSKYTDHLAINVLAEAGRSEDVLAIWNATHSPATYPPLEDKLWRSSWNWYDSPSLGWLATIRLTNHLAAPR